MNHIHYISSTSNSIVKTIVSLHANKGRQQEGLFIAQGTRTSTTLLQSTIIKPHSLFATEKDAHTADELSKQYEIPWYLVSNIVMEKISTVQSPSGLLLVAHIPEQKKYADNTQGVVLADITDPGNAGTLIRTAAACNIKHVIAVQGVDVWNPKVIQASAGSIGFVHIHELTWNELLQTATKESLCALVADQTKTDIKNSSLKNKLLVIGNEAHGIKPEWLSDCGQQVTVPMKGNTESLNAATAGSIALYVATNQ
jgi:TrmH family RNA methyltransferase